MEPRKTEKEDEERRLRRRCDRESLRGEPAWERCREDEVLYEWCVSSGESGPLKNYSSATHERYASVVSPEPLTVIVQKTCPLVSTLAN